MATNRDHNGYILIGSGFGAGRNGVEQRKSNKFTNFDQLEKYINKLSNGDQISVQEVKKCLRCNIKKAKPFMQALVNNGFAVTNSHGAHNKFIKATDIKTGDLISASEYRQ